MYISVYFQHIFSIYYSIYLCLIFHPSSTDMNRLEKSPLLANGYNPPPINHMAFMQMNTHHPGAAALMSPGMPPHAALHARPESQMLKAAAAQSAGMSAANMDALARSGIWENCRAAYEDIVKHLERLREERTDERQQAICGGGGAVGSGAGGAGGGIDRISLSMGSERDAVKPRDLSSHNCKRVAASWAVGGGAGSAGYDESLSLLSSGSPTRQSPVLNLSKSGENTDHGGSNCDAGSERSDCISTAASPRVTRSLADEGSRGGLRSGSGGGGVGGAGSSGIIGIEDDDEDEEEEEGNLSDENHSEVDERCLAKDVDGEST